MKHLIKYKEFLNLRAIEKYLNIPETTLNRVVNGSRELTEKYKEPLIKLLNDIGACEHTIKGKEQTEKKPVEKIKPRVITSGKININDYIKLLGNRYKHKKTGEQVVVKWVNGEFNIV